jgi:hypothetical protein
MKLPAIVASLFIATGALLPACVAVAAPTSAPPSYGRLHGYRSRLWRSGARARRKAIWSRLQAMTTAIALTATGLGMELTIGAIGAPATIQAGRASVAGALGRALTRAGKWGRGAADSTRPRDNTAQSYPMSFAAKRF